MSFTAGFDRLKRAYERVKGKQWQTRSERIAKVAQESRNLEMHHEMKALCEELANLAAQTQDEFTWKIIADFLEIISHCSQDIEYRLAEIQTLDTLEKKRMALLELISGHQLIDCLTEQLQHLFANGHPDAQSGMHSKQSMQRQKMMQEGMNRLFADVEVAQNQANYTPIGRIMNRIFDILFYLMDCLLIHFGRDPAFLIKGEEHHSRQSIMPMKM